MHDLKELLNYNRDKNIIWLTLNKNQGKEIEIALNIGFCFHSCKKDTLTLTYTNKDIYIPFIPTHTVGVGAIVINKNKILLVQDKINKRIKIPGGMLDIGSSLEDTVLREVYEETGIKCKLITLLAILNTNPYRFENSNSYYIFKLKPLNTNITIADTNEIEKAYWCDIEHFFNNKNISEFQKIVVKKALNSNGLTKINTTKLWQNKQIAELYI
jgi:ADP-ribose pyrophosphatase YjhB (NUDIX family)